METVLLDSMFSIRMKPGDKECEGGRVQLRRERMTEALRKEVGLDRGPSKRVQPAFVESERIEGHEGAGEHMSPRDLLLRAIGACT